jgi:RHS repeat-associated protein
MLAAFQRTGVADIGQFTGKERDSETGLDYFGARYFSGAQGRFTSPDPKIFPNAVYDPQSWNKYGYTRNNPLRYVDPDGEDWQDALKGAINAWTSDNAAGAGRVSSGNGDFRMGQAIGDAVATVQGAVEMLGGAGGEAGGLALDATGVGAIAGVPLNVVSAGVIVHGTAVAGVGLKNLAGAALDPQDNSTFERRANDFSSAEKNRIDSRNASQNGGVNKCEGCGQQVVKVQSQKGVATPSNQMQRHHKKLASQGGPGKAENAEVLCKDCHVEKHRKMRQDQP